MTKEQMLAAIKLTEAHHEELDNAKEILSVVRTRFAGTIFGAEVLDAFQDAIENMKGRYEEQLRKI